MKNVKLLLMSNNYRVSLDYDNENMNPVNLFKSV